MLLLQHAPYTLQRKNITECMQIMVINMKGSTNYTGCSSHTVLSALKNKLHVFQTSALVTVAQAQFFHACRCNYLRFTSICHRMRLWHMIHVTKSEGALNYPYPDHRNDIQKHPQNYWLAWQIFKSGSSLIWSIIIWPQYCNLGLNQKIDSSSCFEVWSENKKNYLEMN